MSKIKLGSLFDGIGVFPLAAAHFGIEPSWASEIEKVPISITKRHFPNMQHLGDITKLHGKMIPQVDIITFFSFEWVRCPICGNKTRLQIRAGRLDRTKARLMRSAVPSQRGRQKRNK